MGTGGWGVFPSKQIDGLLRYKRVKVSVGLLGPGKNDHRKRGKWKR